MPRWPFGGAGNGEDASEERRRSGDRDRDRRRRGRGGRSSGSGRARTPSESDSGTDHEEPEVEVRPRERREWNDTRNVNPNPNPQAVPVYYVDPAQLAYANPGHAPNAIPVAAAAPYPHLNQAFLHPAAGAPPAVAPAIQANPVPTVQGYVAATAPASQTTVILPTSYDTGVSASGKRWFIVNNDYGSIRRGIYAYNALRTRILAAGGWQITDAWGPGSFYGYAAPDPALRKAVLSGFVDGEGKLPVFYA